jgi:hypothetical protein
LFGQPKAGSLQRLLKQIEAKAVAHAAVDRELGQVNTYLAA